jgi:hypothetical protein
MVARTAFLGSGISKGMVAVIAVLAALMLGAAGGYLARTLSLPTASIAAHVVAGQPGASGYGSAWNYSSRRSGTQSVEGPVPEAAPVAKFREPGSRRGGPQI